MWGDSTSLRPSAEAYCETLVAEFQMEPLPWELRILGKRKEGVRRNVGLSIRPAALLHAGALLAVQQNLGEGCFRAAKFGQVDSNRSGPSNRMDQ